MNNNPSTQLPSPPELQPIHTISSKIWHIASLALTIGGIALMAVGGWIFFRMQIEAHKSPPARIIEYSAEELEADNAVPVDEPDTITSKVEPSAPAINTGDGPTRPDEPAAPQPAQAPDVIKQNEVVAPEQEIEAPLDDSTTQNIGAIENEQENEVVPPDVPFEPEPLSLADNPLLVVEGEAETSVPDQTESANEAGSTALNAPLTRVVAESIGLDSEVTAVGWESVVQDGVSTNVWRVADYAAGWHTNSTLPGQGGNIVLSAHHNIKGEVFRYTVDLEPGDIITLYDESHSYDYVVEDKFIVKDKGEPEAARRENAKWIGPFNEERLTLVTCWPYTNNTHRLIVIAKPVGSSTSG